MAHRYDALIETTPDDERPCALNVAGVWYGTSCDWSTAINQVFWGTPDTDIEFSPYMDDREDLA